MSNSGPQTTQEWRAFLADLRGYILACIGDEEGRRAVEQHRVLTLTAGQVQVLVEALALIDAALESEPIDDPRAAAPDA